MGIMRRFRKGNLEAGFLALVAEDSGQRHPTSEQCTPLNPRTRRLEPRNTFSALRQEAYKPQAQLIPITANPPPQQTKPEPISLNPMKPINPTNRVNPERQNRKPQNTESGGLAGPRGYKTRSHKALATRPGRSGFRD